jgi:hypothetical protein
VRIAIERQQLTTSLEALSWGAGNKSAVGTAMGNQNPAQAQQRFMASVETFDVVVKLLPCIIVADAAMNIRNVPLTDLFLTTRIDVRQDVVGLITRLNQANLKSALGIVNLSHARTHRRLRLEVFNC